MSTEVNKEKYRPAQSLEPPWRQASLLLQCSGSAATEQDPCKTVIATSKVDWAAALDCVPEDKTLHVLVDGKLVHLLLVRER